MKTTTATEQELIDYLKRRGFTSFGSCWGRKPTGGKVSVRNTRRINAARKLEAAGLVTVETHAWTETAHGYAEHGVDYVLRATETFKQQFN